MESARESPSPSCQSVTSEKDETVLRILKDASNQIAGRASTDTAQKQNTASLTSSSSGLAGIGSTPCKRKKPGTRLDKMADTNVANGQICSVTVSEKATADTETMALADEYFDFLSEFMVFDGDSTPSVAQEISVATSVDNCDDDPVKSAERFFEEYARQADAGSYAESSNYGYALSQPSAVSYYAPDAYHYYPSFNLNASRAEPQFQQSTSTTPRAAMSRKRLTPYSSRNIGSTGYDAASNGKSPVTPKRVRI